MPTMRSLREAISTSSPICLFERARHGDLVGCRRRSALRHGRHAGPALWRAEYVHIARRIAKRGRAACVYERNRRVHTGGRGDPLQVRRRKRGGPDERAGRAGLDKEHIHAERIDRLVGLDPESIGEPGEGECHREDDAGGEDRDDEAPSSPLHVAQRGEEHVREVTDACLVAGGVWATRWFAQPPRPAWRRRQVGRRACGWTPKCLGRASIRRPRRRPSWLRR